MSNASRGVFAVINTRGGERRFGTGSNTDFTPAKLLLGATVGRTAIDVDILTSRRAEPGSFQMHAEADKTRDAHGNRLTGIAVTFQIAFPDGADGDQTRAILPDAVKKSHGRLRTVGRTVPACGARSSSGRVTQRCGGPGGEVPGVVAGSHLHVVAVAGRQLQRSRRGGGLLPGAGILS